MSKTKSEIEEIKQKEETILKEVRRIKTAEERIKTEEDRILAAEQAVAANYKKSSIFSIMTNANLSGKELKFFRILFAHRIAKHKLLFGVLATVGVVLIWRGVWHTADEIPILSYSLVSLVIGIFLVWLIKRYTDLS